MNKKTISRPKLRGLNEKELKSILINELHLCNLESRIQNEELYRLQAELDKTRIELKELLDFLSLIH